MTSSFEYEVYGSINDLTPADAALLLQAKEVTKDAYAPYSQFHVGAAAKLANGEVVRGTNQENASYPVGICSERTLLSVAATLYPNMPIDTIAITYDNKNGSSNTPASPCGICRQSLAEFETRVKQPMRLILSGLEGKVFIIPKASLLLPLGFGSDDLK
ncbi:cytidine deaminase [Parasediminibacterium paludis]|uniref:Cytidine deaminase n=1 Tax=Parasediminibacterium paludis TaxID=908966 RepID=A0ABV8PXW4_9BACT